ncbi:MAG: hypothetical protein JSU87_07295 [Gemmatimonadota bacterium]|nr:MAG: hypothetical protein JSU87_07295 [Gemmatimonadota bacterium]
MTGSLESLGRIRAKGIALLLATFVAGALAGTAAERILAARRAPEAPGFEIGMARGLGEGRLLGPFRELDLTLEQRARISEIIERGRPRTDAVMREMLPRLRAITDSVHLEIRAVLTPEQEAVWDSLLTRTHRRGARFSGPRGRLPEGRPPPFNQPPEEEQP